MFLSSFLFSLLFQLNLHVQNKILSEKQAKQIYNKTFEAEQSLRVDVCCLQQMLQ